MNQQLLDFLLTQSGPWPYLIIFLLLLACGMGLPLPEDIVLFAAGLVSYYGAADIYWMILVSFFGIMLGDSVMFMLGARFSHRILNLSFVQRLLPPYRMILFRDKLHRKGGRVIFAARFMPGLRAPIFFTSGTMHFPFHRFFFFDGMAALISVPAIVFATYHFGSHVDSVIGYVKNAQFGIVGLILALVALYFAKKKWLGRKGTI